MWFSVLLAVCGVFVVPTRAILPPRPGGPGLPSPVVQLNSFGLGQSGQTPWSEVCCVLHKEIHLYFHFTQIITIDRIDFDIDYFCDHLAYTVNQLITVQKTVHDCRTISVIIAKMVAQTVMEARAKTTTAVFNNAVLHAYRTATSQLIDSTTYSKSVTKVIESILGRYHVGSSEISYIKRRVAHSLNAALTTPMVTFLERMEISHTLIRLQTLQVQIMQIVNGTSFSNDLAVSQIKRAIKTMLSQTHQMETYHMRAYYLAYFRFFSRSLVSAKAEVLKELQILQHSEHMSRLSRHEIGAIVQSVEVAFSGVTQWVTGLENMIATRNRGGIAGLLAGSSGSLNAYIGGLVDKLGWVNRVQPTQPKDLLTEYKDVLAKLESYKTVLQGFATSLSNVPPSEAHYHRNSLQFVQGLIAAVKAELKENSWVHKIDNLQGLKVAG